MGVDSKLDSNVEHRNEIAIALNKNTNSKVIMVCKKSVQ